MFATILPSDMLVFFGYNDGKSDDFKTKWLNLAWGRRIVSGIRIIVQFTGINGLLNGDYVMLVCVSQISYFIMILIGILPQDSSYDGQACYRNL